MLVERGDFCPTTASRSSERPIVTVRNVRDLIGTTYPTANNLVSRLVEDRILYEVSGQTRNRVFLYQDYIHLFHDTDSNAQI